MKLDRNTRGDGKGRFSVIDNRTGERIECNDPVHGFFVIKLKDRFAKEGLRAYAHAALRFADGHGLPELAEYAIEVEKLADIAGVHHPACKVPD